MTQTTMHARLQITPSIRQQDVVRSTEEYMVQKVEPILDELITYLVLQRPKKKDLGKFVVEWLVQKQAGKELVAEPDIKSQFKRSDIDASIRLLMEGIVTKRPLPEKPIDALVEIGKRELYQQSED